MKFKNKIVVVTGAGSGLGEAISKRFAKEGAKVVVVDINLNHAEKVAKEIKVKYKKQTLPLLVDVTHEKQVQDMVKNTLKKFGKIDILVSNAGILIAEEITEFPVDKWRNVIDVNLVGYFICAKEVAKAMKNQRSGVIIQINSKSGKKGSFKNSAYAASKFGGIGLTQSMALDLSAYGIRVNAVCPGNLLDSPLWVNSLFNQYSKKWGISKEEVKKKYLEQIPIGRGCTYDDVCNVVTFLASDESSYMTGQAINVTGGQEMR
ncbi:MAG: sorbitol-6-phosphate dehydrogenase [Candidatus Firestonebacteria bacterium]